MEGADPKVIKYTFCFEDFPKVKSYSLDKTIQQHLINILFIHIHTIIINTH